MVIDQSGNVGIGASSPNHDLHISSGNPVIMLDHTTNGILGYIGNSMDFLTSGAGGTGGIRSEGDLRFGSGGNNLRDVEGTTGKLDKNFGHAYAEGVRFGPSTESGYTTNYSVAIASNDHLIRFADADGNVHGSIRTSGSGVVYNTSSDYRVKENVTSLGNALERLNRLSPKRFTWINYPELGEHDGFIAHEVDEVVPEAVDGEKDRMRDNGDVWPQGLDMSKLIPLLTASIQELSAKVTALENAS